MCLQTGIEKLTNLKVLFASNNKIKEWVEVDRLKCLPALEHVLLAGNPLHQDYKERNAASEYRLEVNLLSVEAITSCQHFGGFDAKSIFILWLDLIFSV